MRPTQRVQLAHVNELAHSAIRLAGIKGYFALKANGLDNQLGELTDGEFLAGAHIDVAVADLAQAGDIAATTGTVVAVNHSVSSHTIVYAGVFLYTNDVTEVHIQEYVHTGICQRSDWVIRNTSAILDTGTGTCPYVSLYGGFSIPRYARIAVRSSFSHRLRSWGWDW